MTKAAWKASPGRRVAQEACQCHVAKHAEHPREQDPGRNHQGGFADPTCGFPGSRPASLTGHRPDRGGPPQFLEHRIRNLEVSPTGAQFQSGFVGAVVVGAARGDQPERPGDRRQIFTLLGRVVAVVGIDSYQARPPTAAGRSRRIHRQTCGRACADGTGSVRRPRPAPT